MLRWLRYKVRLRRLRKTQEQIAASYSKEAAAAERAKRSRSEVAGIWDTAGWENDFQEEEVRKLHTSYLLSTAADMFLPVPHGEDDWADCGQTGGRCLTIQAASALHREIRKERADRYQQFLQFLPFVTALIGIIGALTGLSAVMRK